jgi:hypothetical protein
MLGYAQTESRRYVGATSVSSVLRYRGMREWDTGRRCNYLSLREFLLPRPDSLKRTETEASEQKAWEETAVDSI